jgi:hypothetical protein
MRLEKTLAEVGEANTAERQRDHLPMSFCTDIAVPGDQLTRMRMVKTAKMTIVIFVFLYRVAVLGRNMDASLYLLMSSAPRGRGEFSSHEVHEADEHECQACAHHSATSTPSP